MKTAAIDQNESAGKQMSKHIKIHTSSFPPAREDAVIIQTGRLVFGTNFTGIDDYTLTEDTGQISLACKQRDRIYLQKQKS